MISQNNKGGYVNSGLLSLAQFIHWRVFAVFWTVSSNWFTLENVIKYIHLYYLNKQHVKIKV